MSATSDLLQLLFEVAQDLRTTRNIALASAVTLLYETILTFPDEYALIWMGPMGSGKILYLASRYPLLLKTILREVYNMGFGQSLNSLRRHELFRYMGDMALFHTRSIDPRSANVGCLAQEDERRSYLGRSISDFKRFYFRLQRSTIKGL
ncbi:hypothetical protein BD410DRAFT_127062 [Rickenella mellea]|uniref:DUF6533 domain-containing protein n=1 Tax=Rickenella mellea TaxID=50990 RepID=A0A4Y7Q8B2_9AGAM|nr:hypothetical protein BD410DRAFT_127062 [Rickenella mellea]